MITRISAYAIYFLVGAATYSMIAFGAVGLGFVGVGAHEVIGGVCAGRILFTMLSAYFTVKSPEDLNLASAQMILNAFASPNGKLFTFMDCTIYTAYGIMLFLSGMQFLGVIMLFMGFLRLLLASKLVNLLYQFAGVKR